MFKRMLLIGFLSYCSYVSASAQNVTVRVTDTTHVQDSLRSVDQKLQQIVSAKQELQHRKVELPRSKAIDSLQSLSSSITTKRIHSEKQLKVIRDSIEKATGFKIPTDNLKKYYMSEEEMVQHVNSRFPEYPNRTNDQWQEMGKDSLESITKEAPTVLGMNQLKLSPDQLLQLSPLAGRTIDTKYLKYIDSLRKINLKEEQLKLEEKMLSEKSRLVSLVPKPTFRQRSYFEGILGVMTGKSTTLYQASPALGFHFTDNFSLGAGPSLQIRTVDKEVDFNAAIRAFSKIEFFKRQLYLQVEDCMSPFGANTEKNSIEKHNVMVGGGVLLSMKAPVTLNFSVLYRVDESKLSVSDFAPLVFRIGISTIKINK